MSVIIPDCPCCKNCNDREDKSKPLTCKAFPDGIPSDYLWCKIDVKKIKECARGYKFELDLSL